MSGPNAILPAEDISVNFTNVRCLAGLAFLVLLLRNEPHVPRPWCLPLSTVDPVMSSGVFLGFSV